MHRGWRSARASSSAANPRVGGFAAYACRGKPGGYAADAACEDTLAFLHSFVLKRVGQRHPFARTCRAALGALPRAVIDAARISPA